MDDRIKKIGIRIRRAVARWTREHRTDSTVQEAQPQSDVVNRETARRKKESLPARPVSGEPQGAANPTCLTSPDDGISAQKDKEIFSQYQETISKNRETNQKERETRTEAGSSFPLRPLTIQAFQPQPGSQTSSHRYLWTSIPDEILYPHPDKPDEKAYSFGRKSSGRSIHPTSASVLVTVPSSFMVKGP